MVQRKWSFNSRYRNRSSGFSLTRDVLAKLRLRARRRGCWFSVLKSSERRLLDLTIKVVQFVRSRKLAKVLTSILQVLERAMESRISVLIRTEGKELATRLSRVATSLGCQSAGGWAFDRGFWQYLAVMNLGGR